MATSLDTLIQAPEGTKLWLLHLGDMEADEGWFKRGGGTTLASNPRALSERRELVVISALIEHPTEGLILFETGSGKNHPENWGAPLNDIFAQVNYHPDQELDAQIARTGHKISDVKAVIMGHLHLDHAGGLDYFRGTDVPIYVHEQELKHAFYSVANKSDLGVYLPQNLGFDLNWKGFHGDFLEIAQGLTIRHSPGHTPGLCILQVNLKDSGTWIFTTDQYHVYENFEADHPQGWLARDHDDWVRSHQMIRMLAKRTNAKLVFGHCKDTFNKYKQAPHAYI
ncbi:putative metallo-beta-lactamase superfamily protein [Neofusicoccum parvum]|uniref:Putative metallo-beta-lactamase superfamily protein n=1 Tax=Botryosphaeria parva (strain UCR-NP2) TaxID=1287680 RepID=R1EEZ3_BOTPV|nr:putative metallo-beta-lactamase superfamily protein [Neofusicoccum parvum UCRNP2]GME65426.1 putative metallo-beta-lactamase superfamily protein [Neofusicoccum parvum]